MYNLVLSQCCLCLGAIVKVLEFQTEVERFDSEEWLLYGKLLNVRTISRSFLRH
jgi:hypothetical protein